MTPTEQWIFGLVLVYSVPAFLSGIAMTLLVVRWRDIRCAIAEMPRFLFLQVPPEHDGVVMAGLSPADGAREAATPQA